MDTRKIANRYDITKHLADIDESNYYEGIDTNTDTPVILKTTDLNQLGKVGAGLEHLAKDKLRRKMENEKQFMGRLNHRGFLMPMFDGCEGDLYYQIYPSFPFRTLEMQIQGYGALPLTTALLYMRDTAEILSVLHDLEIVHCNICAETILLVDDHIKIIGFTLANHNQVEGVAPGNPPYMGPEAITGAALSKGSDIWSLGVTFYYVLTGTLPFGDIPSPRQAGVPILFGRILRDTPNFDVPPLNEAPSALVDLLRAMLRKDPERRAASMEQVKAAMDVIIRERNRSSGKA